MIRETPRWTNNRERLYTAARNLRSAQSWRVHDVVNWGRLLKSLRALEFSGEAFNPYGLAYNIFTKLFVDYTPHEPVEDWNPVEARPPMPDLAGVDNPSVALFVDAPDHVSGVATTLGNWSASANRAGCPLEIIHAGFRPFVSGATCFTPLGSLALGAYDGLTMHVPHVPEVLDYVQAHPVDVVHISTPGPMGLLGLLAARMLKVPVCGTYHTDFPRYAVKLSGDATIEDIAWNYMRWFFGQMSLLAAPSPATRDDLVNHGLDGQRIRVVGRGVDPTAFSPERRDDALRAAWGTDYPCKLLYVGRVSEEKNMACLAEAYLRLHRTRPDVQLIVVGDGPYRETMEARLRDLPVVFTGLKTGEELQRIYASSDLFVFPSETDTLGVVVLEAQASGVSALVSGRGGPRHCIEPGTTGVVLEEMTPSALADTLAAVLADPARLRRMGGAARQHSRGFTLDRSFEGFWELHRLAVRARNTTRRGLRGQPAVT
jgi:glycosyltransferase involved in cell wall biosynthesis